METWKDIPGYPNYQASSLGRIRSVDHIASLNDPDGMFRVVRKRMQKGKVIVQRRVGTDHRLSVCFSHGNKITRHYVSRLVLLAFHGPCPAGMEGSHLNGDKDDNLAENLAWETPKENNKRKREHGTYLVGERCASSKLTRREVEEIRSRYLTTDLMQYELADIYGVKQTQISRIVNRKHWG